MTEKELFQETLKRMTADKELSAILKKMKAGTADFEDMQRYSLRTAEIKAEVLKENLSPAGSGQNEEACIQLLKDQHEDIFQKESAVQKVLDEKQNIHIAAKKPKFPAERVRKAAHSLEDKTVSEEVIQRRAENAVANIANSFHDDYIRENAKFRQNAGLKCHVTRIGASECCAWCAEVAGSYEVGKEPVDFWRRHDNCTCRMNYENQKVRQRLSGTGKGWKVDSEVQRRQAQRIEYKPKRFSKDEAKALENEKLSRIKGLTANQNGDIMNLERRNANIGAFSEIEIPMQKKAIKQICKKYGIDIAGLTIKIQRDESLVGKPFCGMTDYDNIGRIDLLPSAFSSEEQLVRTIIHERLHVMQLRKHGKEYCQSHLNEMEHQAYWFEDHMYPLLRKRVK